MTLDLGQWWTLPRFDGDLRPIGGLSAPAGTD